MNGLVQLHSPHSGKPLPHARCWTSVVSIVPLKNNTDSSPGKLHIFISCGQEGSRAPSDKFQLSDCSGARLSGALIHLLCRLAVGDAHLCPRGTSERGETKDHVGLQLPLQTLSTVQTQAQPYLVGSQQSGCFCSAPGTHPPNHPHWGLFLWILSQPMASIQGDWLTSGLHLIPRLPTSQSSTRYILQPLQNASCSEMLWG